MNQRSIMENHKVVSKEEWVTARKEHLKKEKEFTRQRDELRKESRALPWLKIEKNYKFEYVNGKVTLSDLFDGKSQLIIYHFMLGPEWEEGCSGCSFLADSYNGAEIHLKHRDVSFVTVSRAPLKKINEYKKRMGWNITWLSSFGSEFNFDFNVSFTEEEKKEGKVYYNYDMNDYFSDEGPGISVFYKNNNGEIFHTYSTYQRGLDQFIVPYHLLDIVPKGRDEEGLNFGMEWLRHHDKYGEDSACCK